MTSRLPLVLTLAIACLLVVSPSSTRAEEEDLSQMHLKLYPVSALTMGRWHFTREHEPVVHPDEERDEAHPLFGAVAEEPVTPVGWVDELIEQLKGQVEPVFWEVTEGADIRALGNDVLVVRASPSVHAAIVQFLANLERSVAQTVTVEVLALHVDAAEAQARLAGGDPLVLSAEAADALLAGSEVAAGFSVLCFSGQRAAAYGGRQVAWVGDCDVEVAQESSTSDPIVIVSNLGIMAHVLPVVEPGGAEILVGLDAALARIPELRSAPTARNGRMEAPRHEVAVIRPVVRVPAGRWAVVDGRLGRGGEPLLFLLRATPHAFRTSRSPSPVIDLGPPVASRVRSFDDMAVRTFDVRDLTTPVRSVAGDVVTLMPSNFTHLALPEMPEPVANFRAEILVELLRSMGRGSTWEDPASIEAQNGRLIVRNDPAVLAVIQQHLDAMRAYARTYVVSAEIVDVPEAIGRELASVGVLDAAAKARLAQARAEGGAETIDVLRLTSYGARNTTRVGEEVSYLQDFNVEIAQASSIGDPVFETVLSGAQLDLDVGRSSDGGSVQLNVEMVRSRVGRPIRTHSTQHGDIELPELELFRIRTGVQTPLGETVVAGSWAHEGRRRLLLLTPQVR